MKAGSTYFSQLLGSHPQVFISTPKEPCHFCDPEPLRALWPHGWELGFWRSVDAYLALFSGAGPAIYAGEASTSYTHLPRMPDIARRIHQFSPDARILYIMRDPIDRTISHYWHAVQYFGENRKPLAAIRDEPHYMAVSDYASQLTPYLELFGARQVHALTFERLVRHPVETTQAVFRWLGVDDSIAPPAVDVAVNATPELLMQQQSWKKTLTNSRLWRAVARYRPEALRTHTAALGVKPVHPNAVPMDRVIRFLRPIQQAQTLRLRALLQRDFPEWQTLNQNAAPHGASWPRFSQAGTLMRRPV
jgi:hypothetical protein